MSEFMTVGAAGDVEEGEVKAFKVGDREVAVANVGGKLYAFDDICTHQQCNLSYGELDGTTIECDCHGSQFDVTSGEVLNGPATDPVDVFEVREEGGDLQIQV